MISGRDAEQFGDDRSRQRIGQFGDDRSRQRKGQVGDDVETAALGRLAEEVVDERLDVRLQGCDGVRREDLARQAAQPRVGGRFAKSMRLSR
jgi:hypothetical protein